MYIFANPKKEKTDNLPVLNLKNLHVDISPKTSLALTNLAQLTEETHANYAETLALKKLSKEDALEPESLKPLYSHTSAKKKTEIMDKDLSALLLSNPHADGSRKVSIVSGPLVQWTDQTLANYAQTKMSSSSQKDIAPNHS